MSVEQNIEVVRRLGEALTNRDWAAFDDLVAEDCEWTDVPSGRTMHGRDELIAGCKSFTDRVSRLLGQRA
jgi:ketosteroid isomerase-like protein